MATTSLWGMLLLSMGNLELANALTNSYYHHIDAAYDCSMYYQLSNPFCLCPGQQATTCSACATKIYKTSADYKKYHSALDGLHYKDSEARLARGGGPVLLPIPAPEEVTREISTTLFPKNWASLLLKVEC